MKRAYIENVPHNFEALTITVSGGNHWAGRQITVGRTRQDDNPSNFALVGTAASSKPTFHPLPPKIPTVNKQTWWWSQLLLRSSSRSLWATPFERHHSDFSSTIHISTSILPPLTMKLTNVGWQKLFEVRAVSGAGSAPRLSLCLIAHLLAEIQLPSRK